VLLPSVLAACAPPAFGPTSTGGATKPAAAGGSALPNYLPLQGGPKPDYASAGQQYEDGWDNYPSPPVKSWTKAPPGTGSTINVLGQAFNPPATPYDQNPAWQEVKKRLNANVQFTVVPIADYPAKLGTTMASDDLPDLMLFPGD
jgi:putative aldouronate transport system substrate-binding protein